MYHKHPSPPLNSPPTKCITNIPRHPSVIHSLNTTTTWIQTPLPHPSMIHPPPHNLPDLPPSLPSSDLQPSPWQPHIEHLQYLPGLLWLSAHPGPSILQNQILVYIFKWLSISFIIRLLLNNPQNTAFTPTSKSTVFCCCFFLQSHWSREFPSLFLKGGGDVNSIS